MMDAQRWRRARELFDELVDTPQAGWNARVAEACADDPLVRDEVLAMLRADQATGQQEIFDASLPAAVVELAGRLAGVKATDAEAGHEGRSVGPFRLVREIGRGGMGAVWFAERADGAFEQRVAVKLIRSGWDVDEVLARFRAERQILAGLQHPNIAHLVDGGITADGKPWLALEYIDGEDLRAWCDSRRLDLAARLQLFLTVCDAVAHAHQRLVVHRDLKPSNILVGNDGVVKLLDFGIAKLLDGTDAGISSTRMFTPEYAAPEQVRGELLTTAVDIHALGLLLYELLCGRRPFEADHPTPAAYERAVLDREPTRPSLALARGDDAGAAIAACRDLAPARLRRELRGDLDAIVLKALRKEPGQRYASVQAFADDVRRHLARQPVLARRGSWRYRSARFLRRHALAATLAGVAVFALCAGLGAALWQARVANVQRDSARAALAFMRSLFDNADPAHRKGDQLSARDLLDAGVRTMRTALPGEDAARGELLLTMASAYLGLEQLDAAAPLIEEVRASAEARADRAQLAAAMIQQCRLRDLGNHPDDCPPLLDHAESLLDPREPEQARLVAYSLALRVYGLQLANRYEAVVESMRRGLALLGDRREDRYLRVELASHLAFALNRLGRPAEAERVLAPWLAELRHDDDTERVLLVDTLGTLSSSLSALGRHDEAIAMQREAIEIAEKLYGRDDPTVAESYNTLARTLNGAGRIDEAVAAMEHAVELDRRNEAGGRNPELASALCNLAVLLVKQEHYADALARLDEAVELAREAEFDADLGRSLWWRAVVHLVAGRTADARADGERMADVLAPSHAAGDDAMLRGRALAFAAALIEQGPAAATAPACADAGAIAEAFMRTPQAAGADARFAAYLAMLCTQHAPPVDPAPPLAVHYARIVARIRDAWAAAR
ncbi:serine/threonine-protein kinase [Dokdonella fugitiva]|uniref:serine/threonine-protein kinase n=1 Tax=Dokdonella fugitiva TaxID=328517 RepID=UPI0015FC85CF|nr:serine/threonine-protein kinase [Dokdonella fugitiva]MBA8883348.1 serine/threonine-protein kinase [Dokdonella fugitiva]